MRSDGGGVAEVIGEDGGGNVRLGVVMRRRLVLNVVQGFILVVK